MSHNEVYKQFELHCPDYAGEKVDVWFLNGKNSIRVRLKDKRVFVFTYNSPSDWKFETVDSFLKSMKGKNKNG